MARLPSEQYLVQSDGDDLVIFHLDEGRELLRFNVTDANTAAQAQLAIHNLTELSEEDKCFAHFWSGYFYAHLGGSKL